jgi:hypothetical protein
MSFQDVIQYYDQRGLVDADSKLEEMLPYFCFLSSYAYVLLVDGYGFQKNSTLTVLDQVNGNKVGWPLGAILYEINSLPWELEQTVPREPWGLFFLAVSIGNFVMYMCICVYICIYVFIYIHLLEYFLS